MHVWGVLHEKKKSGKSSSVFGESGGCFEDSSKRKMLF